MWIPCHTTLIENKAEVARVACPRRHQCIYLLRKAILLSWSLAVEAVDRVVAPRPPFPYQDPSRRAAGDAPEPDGLGAYVCRRGAAARPAGAAAEES